MSDQMDDQERIEYIARLACDLLEALQPWEIHGKAVQSAGARLTLALAALPLPPDPKVKRLGLPG